jgi:hypothetical protein
MDAMLLSGSVLLIIAAAVLLRGMLLLVRAAALPPSVEARGMARLWRRLVPATVVAIGLGGLLLAVALATGLASGWVIAGGVAVVFAAAVVLVRGAELLICTTPQYGASPMLGPIRAWRYLILGTGLAITATGLLLAEAWVIAFGAVLAFVETLEASMLVSALDDESHDPTGRASRLRPRP